MRFHYRTAEVPDPVSMKAPTTPAAVLGVAASCLLAVECEAGVNFGVRAYVSNGPGGANESTDYGAVPGTYAASVTGTSIAVASANLLWQTDGVVFSGSALGGSGSGTPWAESSFLASVTITQACNVTINWNMQSLVTTGNLVSWVINDGSSDLFGVEYSGDPISGTFVGVPSATATGAFTSTSPLAAGTYIIGMVGTANVGGGSLDISVTFAPVPAPGALPALAVMLCGVRRRRAT